MDSGAAALRSPAEDLNQPKAPGRARSRMLRRAEPWLVLVLAALTFVVHDVPYLLAQPFWTDEAWVAVTTRFPLSELPRVTSSTPIGWSLLLRVSVLGGGQRLRLLPLSFAALTVVAAYLFARTLGWRHSWGAKVETGLGVGAGVLAAGAALLTPAMLLRNDLKQYTADACLALTVLLLLSRLEQAWSRKRLAALAAAAAGGMLLSHTTAFVAVAAFAAVLGLQAARRAWPRFVEALLTAAAGGTGMLGVYALFDARAVIPGLISYWSGFYVPLGNGLGASEVFIRTHVEWLQAAIGLGPSWLIAVLMICGLITIARCARPMVALAIVLLGPEMVVFSGLKKYPLFDERTSTFLIVIVVVTVAVGVAGAAALMARWNVLAGAALATAAAVLFTIGASGSVRAHPLPDEDTRSQAAYVYAHSSPDDVVLVNLSSSFGFAYYWPQGAPSRSPNVNVLQSYVPYFPAQPRIIVASNRDPAGVDAALSEALTVARTHPGSRVWLVRTHVNAVEASAWASALQAEKLGAETVDEAGLSVITVG